MQLQQESLLKHRVQLLQIRLLMLLLILIIQYHHLVLDSLRKKRPKMVYSSDQIACYATVNAIRWVVGLDDRLFLDEQEFG